MQMFDELIQLNSPNANNVDGVIHVSGVVLKDNGRPVIPDINKPEMAKFKKTVRYVSLYYEVGENEYKRIALSTMSIIKLYYRINEIQNEEPFIDEL